MAADPGLVVAIDGPSGSGKSSVAQGVAQRFGYRYLDTGAMYRAVTWYVLSRGIDPGRASDVAAVLTEITMTSRTDPRDPRIDVNNTDVTVAIRGTDVTAAVSAVSAVPEVRAFMVRLQRAEVASARSERAGIVVEGRDIGSEVLPDADVKVFLTADPAVRAERRAAQDAASGHGTSGVTATAESLRRRDELDSTRASSPLRMAPDALLVDATQLDLAETIDAVSDLVVAAQWSRHG